MSRSRLKTVRIPHALLDAITHLRQPGGPLADYPNDNAALVGLIVYAVAFPRPHALTAALARMSQADQDKVHDFILEAVCAGRDLRAELPKPATAEALRALALAE